MKSDIVSTFPPSICHEVMGPDTTILVFWMLSFKPAFWLSSFTFIKKQQLEPDMEQWTGYKLGKEYVKAVYCHPAYLICM